MSQTRDMDRANAKVAAIAAAVVFGMLGMAYAAVPLYRMFCQLTGFAGTTQRATKPSDRVLDRVVRVRFDANIGTGLGWRVEPVVRTMDVKIGETSLAFYRASNPGTEPITGTATFNVTPDITGAYFNKLQCFCFTEQTLAAGESIDMPVSFYIDPAMVDDKDGNRVSEITLSYTFYPVDKPARHATGTDGSVPGKKG